jgi:hypothetical protein
MCRHSLHNRENWGIGANMLIQKRKPVPCFDFTAAPTCCPLPNDSTPGTVNTCGRGFPLLLPPPPSSFNPSIRRNASFYRAASRGAQTRLVLIMCLDLWRRLPPRPQVRQEMMMSKRPTMLLMMAVSTAPMPLTMAIRQLPMVRKMASI